MKPQEVKRYEQKLDNLFGKVKDLPDDPEIQSHWARYLCVLVSGYLENSVRCIFEAYASNKCNKKLMSFIESSLGRVQNPKTERVLELAGAFSNQWRTDIEEFLTEDIKAGVNSIVSNRHMVAHGQDVGLTYARVREYYDACKTFTEKLSNVIV